MNLLNYLKKVIEKVIEELLSKYCEEFFKLYQR